MSALNGAYLIVVCVCVWFFLLTAGAVTCVHDAIKEGDARIAVNRTIGTAVLLAMFVWSVCAAIEWFAS